MNFKEYYKMIEEEGEAGATGGTTSTGQGDPSGANDKVGEEPSDPNIARFNKRLFGYFATSRKKRNKWWKKNRLV